jgi:hypothetical protein
MRRLSQREWLFQRCRDLVEELLRALVDLLGWVALLPPGCFAALRVAVANRFLDETFAVTRLEELLRALIGAFRLGRPLLREGCFAAVWVVRLICMLEINNAENTL